MKRNKIYRKLAALGLVGAMTVAMAAPAMAANETISVTGLTQGDKVTVYKILEVDQTTQSGWKVTANAGVTADNIIDGVTAEEYGTILKNISTLSSQKIANAVEVGSDGIWSKANADPGAYIVVVQPKTATTVYGDMTIYNAMVVSSDYSTTPASNTVTAKKETINVEKSSNNTDGTIAAGQTIDFTIDSKVPYYPASYFEQTTKPSYVITDKLTGPIDLTRSTIKVTLGSTELAQGTDYTLGGSGNEFTITLTENALKSISAATSIKVEYKGTVKAADQITENVDKINNDAKVEFSNDPNNFSNKATSEDETNHYVFSIDGLLNGSSDSYTDEVGKIGVDKDGNDITGVTKHSYNGQEKSPLDGAGFTLYNDEACTNVVRNEVTTANNGNITFTGLDAGTYYMKETTVPAGYAAENTVYKVVITATLAADETLQSYSIAFSKKTDDGYSDLGSTNYTLTNTKATDSVTVTKSSATTAFITNTQAKALPSTGGMGTTLFYIVGAVIVAGAGVLLITRRRMNIQ